jgi:hypothetical protein
MLEPYRNPTIPLESWNPIGMLESNRNAGVL